MKNYPVPNASSAGVQTPCVKTLVRLLLLLKTHSNQSSHPDVEVKQDRYEALWDSTRYTHTHTSLVTLVSAPPSCPAYLLLSSHTGLLQILEHIRSPAASGPWNWPFPHWNVLPQAPTSHGSIPHLLQGFSQVTLLSEAFPEHPVQKCISPSKTSYPPPVLLFSLSLTFRIIYLFILHPPLEGVLHESGYPYYSLLYS